MAFIKIQNVVINTDYIAAVRFNNQNGSDKNSVSVLVATPKTGLFEWETVSSNNRPDRWMEFTGQAAKALEDYFSSFNNVIDLLPECHETSLI